MSQNTDESTEERNITRRHWFVFTLISMLFYVVLASSNQSWAASAGEMLVYCLVGLLVVSKATKLSLWLRYAIFIVLLTLLVGQNVIQGVVKTKQDIITGCLTKNPWVSQLENESAKQSFCNCTASELVWPITQEIAFSFVSFRTGNSVQTDPSIMSLVSAAANSCARMAEYP